MRYYPSQKHQIEQQRIGDKLKITNRMLSDMLMFSKDATIPVKVMTADGVLEDCWIAATNECNECTTIIVPNSVGKSSDMMFQESSKDIMFERFSTKNSSGVARVENYLRGNMKHISLLVNTRGTHYRKKITRKKIIQEIFIESAFVENASDDNVRRIFIGQRIKVDRTKVANINGYHVWTVNVHDRTRQTSYVLVCELASDDDGAKYIRVCSPDLPVPIIWVTAILTFSPANANILREGNNE